MILKFLEKLEKKETAEEVISKAYKVYDKQKNALRAIAETEGLFVIASFFEDEKSRCEKEFANGNNDLRIIGEYQLANKFLGYLKNMYSDENYKNQIEQINDL